MFKGAISLIAIVVVCWGLWMTWEWLRNPNKKRRKK